MKNFELEYNEPFAFFSFQIHRNRCYYSSLERGVIFVGVFKPYIKEFGDYHSIDWLKENCSPFVLLDFEGFIAGDYYPIEKYLNPEE